MRHQHDPLPSCDVRLHTHSVSVVLYPTSSCPLLSHVLALHSRPITSSPSAGIQTTQHCGSRIIRYLDGSQLLASYYFRRCVPPIETLCFYDHERACVIFTCVLCSEATVTTPAASVASQYSLSTSTRLPFPQATLSNPDTQSFITSDWGLSKSRGTQNGASNFALQVCQRPLPKLPASGSSSNTPGPVVQAQYLAGSYEYNDCGGAQLYALWNSSGSAFTEHAALVRGRV